MTDGKRVSNVEALKAAGLIVENEQGESLNELYYEVFEGLSNEEMSMLMLLKARLDVVKDCPGAGSYAAHLPL